MQSRSIADAQYNRPLPSGGNEPSLPKGVIPTGAAFQAKGGILRGSPPTPALVRSMAAESNDPLNPFPKKPFRRYTSARRLSNPCLPRSSGELYSYRYC